MFSSFPCALPRCSHKVDASNTPSATCNAAMLAAKCLGYSNSCSIQRMSSLWDAFDSQSLNSQATENEKGLQLVFSPGCTLMEDRNFGWLDMPLSTIERSLLSPVGTRLL